MSFPPTIRPHAIGSVMTATCATPLRLGAMLRLSPTLVSSRKGALPGITSAPVRGQDPSGLLPQALPAANAHLQV
jgi:hypothetical protein